MDNRRAGAGRRRFPACGGPVIRTRLGPGVPTQRAARRVVPPAGTLLHFLPDFFGTGQRRRAFVSHTCPIKIRIGTDRRDLAMSGSARGRR